MITETNIKESATIINCDQATIKAVMEVESSGSGFLDDGTPKILFEPHVFWKQLKSLGIDPASLVAKNPTLSDILYPIWGSKPYGKMSAQHARLKRAVEINKDAALKSASWGLFQIMGYNYAATGSCDLQTFINRMYENEAEHLDMFVTYIKNTGLDDELKAQDWAGFAYQYNGSGYRKNKYDVKLKEAYNKYKSLVS